MEVDFNDMMYEFVTDANFSDEQLYSDFQDSLEKSKIKVDVFNENTAKEKISSSIDEVLRIV